MRSQAFVFAVLFAATAGLRAQVEEVAMPDPKQEEHGALQALTGTWDCVMKMEAMPGVPGMEEPTESKGTEHAELICNGMFLKSTVNSTWKGKPFQGVWIAGYDPFKKQYTSVWVSSDDEECGVCEMDGSYDEAEKTWTWSGTTPHGEMRSEFAMESADRTVETCYMKTPDGKEMKCMEITRQRSKSAAKPADASAGSKAGLRPEQAALLDCAGEWDATVKTAQGGQEGAEEKGTETVMPICNGRWMWSNYTGSFMGAPFEGHALYGYDPNTKKCVSYWFDSMSAVPAKTTGAVAEGQKTMTLEGSCMDPMGNPTTMVQRITKKDANTRVCEMEFKGAEGESTMEITYRRKSAK